MTCLLSSTYRLFQGLPPLSDDKIAFLTFFRALLDWLLNLKIQDLLEHYSNQMEKIFFDCFLELTEWTDSEQEEEENYQKYE